MATAAPTKEFDAEYREDLTLSDGSKVSLRLMRPEDKTLLLEGFEGLSVASRYGRFMGSKTRLTDAEVRYLTETDGVRHVAIGAVALDEIGREHGVGVARFVCLPDEPTVAEPAVTVVDAWQHRGLGRVLLARLVAAARERGVLAFRAHLLADNAAMRGLLRELAPGAVEQPEEDALRVDIPLESAEAVTPKGATAPKSLLERLLALAAQGAFVLLGAVRGAFGANGTAHGEVSAGEPRRE